MHFNMQIRQHDYTVRYMKSQLLIPTYIENVLFNFYVCLHYLILYYINIFKLYLMLFIVNVIFLSF